MHGDLGKGGQVCTGTWGTEDRCAWGAGGGGGQVYRGTGGKEVRQVYYMGELAKANSHTRGNSGYSLGVEPPGDGQH